MKLESVLNSSQLITEYLPSASGITRMNAIKKMFNAAASVKTQKSQLISSFSYKNRTEQMKNHALPHKYIHRVALSTATIRLQITRRFTSTPEKQVEVPREGEVHNMGNKYHVVFTTNESVMLLSLLCHLLPSKCHCFSRREIMTQ